MGWTGARQQFASAWDAEFAIPYAKLGITAGVAKTIGISFWNAWAQSDYRWPTAADWATPSTWGAASSSDNWAVPGAWPMFRHDLRHTGYSPSSAPTTNNTRWTYTAGSEVQSSPAVVDGMVFVGSNDHKVYAFGPAPPPPPPVGGIWVPVDKLSLLAPYIGLISTILFATAATAIYVKHTERRKKKQ